MKYGDFTLGQIEALFNKLGGTDGVNRILRGELTVMVNGPSVPFSKAFIDTHHHFDGELELRNGKLHKNGQEVVLFLDDGQEGDARVRGLDLRNVIKSKTQEPLSASDLDCLLKDPDLIPESWSGKNVFFWGTVFGCFGNDSLYVACLVQLDGKWVGDSLGLNSGFWRECPAAMVCK